MKITDMNNPGKDFRFCREYDIIVTELTYKLCGDCVQKFGFTKCKSIGIDHNTDIKKHLRENKLKRILK